MTDECDIAQLHIERQVEQALKKPKKPELEATGRCFNCDEPLAEGLRFCDADCRDDWQKRRDLNLHRE